MKYSSLIRQIIVDLVKAKNPVPKQFRKYHKGGKYRGERGAPFDDIRENKQKSPSTKLDGEVNGAIAALNDPNGTAYTKAFALSTIEDYLSLKINDYLIAHKDCISPVSLTYDRSHPYYAERVDDDAYIGNCFGHVYNNKIEKYKEKDHMGDPDEIKKVISSAYTSHQFYQLALFGPEERYTIIKDLDEDLLKSLVDNVSKSSHIVKSVIDMFQKDCEKLNIPNIRSCRLKNDMEPTDPAILGSMTEGMLYVNPTILQHNPDTPLGGVLTQDKPFVISKYAKNKEEELMATIWHEMGHQIVRYYTYSPEWEDKDNKEVARYQQMKKIYDEYNLDQLDELFRVFPGGERPSLYPNNASVMKLTPLQQMSPSEYGETNPNELFAENYAAHKMGWDNLLHPKFKELFERLGI